MDRVGFPTATSGAASPFPGTEASGRQKPLESRDA